MNNFWNLASSACGFLAINKKKKLTKRQYGWKGKEGRFGLSGGIGTVTEGGNSAGGMGMGGRMGGEGGNPEAAEIWLPQKENKRESHA